MGIDNAWTWTRKPRQEHTLRYNGTLGLPAKFRNTMRWNASYILTTDISSAVANPTSYGLFKGNDIWNCLIAVHTAGTGTFVPISVVEHTTVHYSQLRQLYRYWYVVGSKLKVFWEVRNNDVTSNFIGWICPSLFVAPKTTLFVDELAWNPGVKGIYVPATTGNTVGKSLSHRMSTRDMFGSPNPSDENANWGATNHASGTGPNGISPSATWNWCIGMTQTFPNAATVDSVVMHVSIEYDTIWAGRENPSTKWQLLEEMDPSFDVTTADIPDEGADSEDWGETDFPAP